MADGRSDRLQGTLDLLVLKVLAAGALHGYAIAQRLRQVSADYLQVPEGSLYPALYRLEAAGAVRSSWKKSDTGREARFYQLTAAGRTRLASEQESWRRFAEAVGLVLASS